MRTVISSILVLLVLAANAVASPIDSVYADTMMAPMIHDSVITADASNWRPGPFDMITNLPGDWWKWSKQTFTIDQLPLIAGISAITAVTIATDYDTWQFTKRPYDYNKTYHDVNDFFAYLGDGKVQFGIAAAFAGYGFIASDSRAIRTASQTVEVIIACGGVVQLLKHLTGRESPFVATTPTGAWRFFPNQIDYAKHVPHYDAFPSGHIATALATLTVITENYPDPWIKYVGYPIIGGIATGLVATSIHWWSDIPLGIALGYSFGRLVAHPDAENTVTAPGQVKTSLGLNVRPLDGAPMLSFAMTW